MTYYVSNGTLNPTHSLTLSTLHWWWWWWWWWYFTVGSNVVSNDGRCRCFWCWMYSYQHVISRDTVRVDIRLSSASFVTLNNERDKVSFVFLFFLWYYNRSCRWTFVNILGELQSWGMQQSIGFYWFYESGSRCRHFFSPTHVITAPLILSTFTRCRHQSFTEAWTLCHMSNLNLRQVVHTLVSLSPSSISWYRCKNWEGNGRLWKRCGLPSITLSVSSLPAQDHGNRDDAAPVCRISCEKPMLTWAAF